MTAIVWLRRDLRLHDHPAFRAAIADNERLVPCFCFDDRLVGGRHASGPRTQFLLECLADLDRSLRARGSGLVLRYGSPKRELPALARRSGATEIHVTDDVSRFARRRDKRVERALGDQRVPLIRHPGLAAVEDLAGITTKAGTPYTVFSPFERAWLDAPRRELHSVPRSLPALPSRLRKGRLPGLRSLGLRQDVEDPAPGGESEARRRLSFFLRDGVNRYATGRDSLGGDGTSRLSPYLRFGCISPREVEARLGRGAGARELRRQLAWRDFYQQVLLHFPANARSEFQDRYRGSIRWSYAHRRFERWCGGVTGFPLVDAGMRQLQRQGWMHNRARLVAGSFLTKDLGIDWRWGERWFMRLLLDGDEAINNGNWQWIASVGVDPAPPFRRLYNPARHQERYDPRGDYVRRYVPELREVPDQYLSEPWLMPGGVQQRSGCVIGEDYPQPMVDHTLARREALERYRAATSS